MSSSQLLVCTTSTTDHQPVVLLADRSYETDDERVFVEGDHEVLRLPLSTPVAVRPIRHVAALGEQALTEALRRVRRLERHP